MREYRGQSVDRKQKDCPVWLPLLLLPAGNLLAALFSPVSVSPRTLLLSLAAAAAEELFFRLFLLKTVLLPRVKPCLSIFVTAVLFAAAHLLNLRSGALLTGVLLQFLCAFCVSVWAGAVVWRKHSILLPLLAHVLLNLTAVTEGKLFPAAASLIVLGAGILLMRGKGPER